MTAKPAGGYIISGTRVLSEEKNLNDAKIHGSNIGIADKNLDMKSNLNEDKMEERSEEVIAEDALYHSEKKLKIDED